MSQNSHSLKNPCVLGFAFIVLLLSSPLFIIQVNAETVNLKITVFDESGFVPASQLGSRKIESILISIYKLNGQFISSKLTNSQGEATFTLNVGTYNVTAGWKLIHDGLGFGKTWKIVDAFNLNTNVELYVPLIIFHSYNNGHNFELDYMDLKTSTTQHETLIEVNPGQTISAEFSWWELETANVPVWYVSVFGSWNPTNPLKKLASGVASPTSYNKHTMAVTFSAPLTPGIYKIRLIGAEDYDWPNSFYTSGHYNPSLGRDMGIDLISKSSDDFNGEGIIFVRKITVEPFLSVNIADSAPPDHTPKDGDINRDLISDWLLSSISDDQGCRIEVWVIDHFPWFIADASDSYAFIFVDKTGEVSWIGGCVYGGGRNDGIVWYDGDNNHNLNPDKFLRTKWTSLDGPDDNPADRKTDGLEKSPQILTHDDDKDGKTDLTVFEYDIAEDNLIKLHYEQDPELMHFVVTKPPHSPFNYDDLPSPDPNTSSDVHPNNDGRSEAMIPLKLSQPVGGFLIIEDTSKFIFPWVCLLITILIGIIICRKIDF